MRQNSPMIRRAFLTSSAAAAGLMATGVSADAAGGEKCTVVLDWLLNPNHAALFAAIQTGAFARAGLDVTLISPSDPDLPPRLVAAGQADLAIGYGTQINMIASAGLPVLRMATLIDRPLNSVVALGGGPIRGLRDLKGKTVGVSVGGVEEAMLDAMVQSVGLAASDIRVVKVNFDMVAALLAHRLDAAIGAFRNAEVLQITQMDRPPQVFLPEQNGIPPYDELIVIGRADRRHDPRLKRFVGALQQGTAALLQNPVALWRAFAAAHPELATPLGRASWQATLPAIAANPARLDAARYLTFQAFAVAHGIASKPMDLTQFAVELT